MILFHHKDLLNLQYYHLLELHLELRNVDAVCPDETVKQAKPPSSAATLFSRTSFVGFMILV